MTIKFLKPLFIISILYIVVVSCCAKKKNAQNTTSSIGLQVCPDEWIQNKMPGTGGTEPNEYFVLEGKRRELKEFDLSWIKKNCNIKPQIVQ